MDLLHLEPIAIAKALAFTTLLYVSYQLVRRSRKRYPPGPRGYPIIGNLFDLPKRDEWVAYKEMSRKYNSNLIHLNVFGTSIVIANSLEVAQDLFDKRSSIYSDRYLFSVSSSHALTVQQTTIGFDWHFAFMPYGELWKGVFFNLSSAGIGVDEMCFQERRKLFHKEFTPPATLLHRPRELEAARKALVQFLDNPDGDYLSKFRHMSGTIILSTAYGIDVQTENDPYVNVSEKAVYAITRAGNIPSYLVDQIPALKYVPEWFPGGTFKKQAREWREYANATPTLPLKFVKDSMAAGTAKSSIASRLISAMDEEGNRTPESETLLQDTLGSIYVAGSDTTTAVLENFVLAMVQNPEILKKGQRAVDEVVGPNRLPDFSDQGSIPYVDALLKEALRWRPITPLGSSYRNLLVTSTLKPDLAAPHCLTTDDEYQGYHIKKNTIVVGNSWAMLHDEVLYGPDTHLYNPERFLTSNGKLNPEVKHPEMLFGFGRRQCPGMDMAESSIWITIASMLACFDIVKAVDSKGCPIEPLEEYSSGMVCRPRRFKCSIRPRSARTETLIRHRNTTIMSQPSQQQLTLTERWELLCKMVMLPSVMLLSTLTCPLKDKPLKRAIFDASVRHMTSDLSIRQSQSLCKPGVVVYQEWARQVGYKSSVEEVGKDARLFWVGPKSAGRIVLYVPGGGYLFPIADYMISFFHRVQQDVNKNLKNQEGLAFVILDYSVHPNAFPTQLLQIISAIGHLFSVGVKPTNLTLIGDSAGANLILQLLSHTLHPIPDLPPSPLCVDGTGPLQGIYLMSPWVGLNEATPSHFRNDCYDILASKSLLYWGSAYLTNVSRSLHHYAKVCCAPKDWFVGIDKVVDRVLITVGGDEVLLDDAVDLKESLEKVHDQVEMDVHPGGVHDDPILDSGANVKTLGPVARLIIAWLSAE
ncbi:hypothetical protein D9758_016055 [Tetrapyrgos nigripes]|uniref:Alpha/beta hydrolase fold-3 domain-containing protein n=1 Tax=Tetrapyrgos nigripes TaxID=182062 RepID=A0A8H5C811_9AGAR|nr:hypothetical protein D9758_016055 [Tetrapyrgos nigripes]